MSAVLERAFSSYEAEKTSEYWENVAQKELIEALETQKLNRNPAKNIILFVGDGMGLPSITAGRILKGQLSGAKGEETSLALDKLKHVGLSKVYCLDKQVPDSASTATAFLTGVKANYFTVGLNGKAQYENCSSVKGNEVTSVLVDAYKAGKSTGIISTTTLFHGTPSPTYAHCPSRFWQDDSLLPEDAKLNGCKDIAEQFFDASDMITVALAGGRQHMLPSTTRDPEYPNKSGKREDGKNLIEMWQNKMKNNSEIPRYVWNKAQFDGINIARTDRLLGLFEPEEMRFDVERSRDGAGEPSLTEMTETAIKMLRKNDNGFFLLVEGGRIDHGHHATIASLSLYDVVAFDKAIEKALEMTNQDDTLIIATADHSHPFTISGYTDRGSDIFGLVKTNSVPELALDKKTYTTLTYANGAGFHGVNRALPFLDFSIPDLSKPTQRRNITDEDTAKPLYMYQSAIPLLVETHSGEDVSIHASGPMAHLFHSVHEQVYIAKVIRYAGCLGGMTSRCEVKDSTSDESTSSNFMIDGRLASLAFAVTFGLSAAIYIKKTRFS